jgi:hypothetical protein
MTEESHPCSIFQDAVDAAVVEFQALLVQADELMDALIVADQLVIDRMEALQNCLAENPMNRSIPTMARNNSDRAEKLKKVMDIMSR